MELKVEYSKSTFRRDELGRFIVRVIDDDGTYIWPDDFSGTIKDGLGIQRATIANSGEQTADTLVPTQIEDTTGKGLLFRKLPLEQFEEGVVKLEFNYTVGSSEYSDTLQLFEVKQYVVITSMDMDSAVWRVRKFIRDDPELNTILGDYESTDSSVESAIRAALTDYNNEPPHIETITLNSLPPGADEIIILGAAYHLLNSVLNWRAREALPFSDGAVQTDPIGAPYQYQSARLQTLYNIYKQKLVDFKTARNFDKAWGDYSLFYDDY